MGDRNVWRCIGSTGRLTMVLLQGSILGASSYMRAECWPTYVALASGGLIGLGLGNRLVKYVDAAACDRWLLLFLCSGSLLMFSAGNRDLSRAAAVFAMSSALILLIAPVVVRASPDKAYSTESPARELSPCQHQHLVGCEGDKYAELECQESSCSDVSMTQLHFLNTQLTL